MVKMDLAFGQDTKNKQSFLFSGFVLILVVLVSLFWLRPRLMAIVKANRDLTASRKTLAELTKKVTTLEGLSKPELTDKVYFALRILPPEKDVPTALSILKKVALNNELIINEMSIAEVGEIASDSAEAETSKNVEEALPSLSVQLTLIGSREKIINFFKQAETTAPLMKVNSLSISQKNEGVDEFLIEVRTYFLPLPKTIGELEQAVFPVTPQEEKIFNELASNFTIFEKSVFEETSTPSAVKLDLFSY